MKLLGAFVNGWDRFQNAMAAVAGVLFWGLLLVVNYEVASRYLGHPTVWASEISSILVLWIPFMVAGWVLRNDGHVKMDLLVERLPPRTRAVLHFFTSLVGAVVMFVVTVAGVMTAVSWIGNRTPTMLMLPRTPIISVVPLGCFFLSVQFLIQAFGNYQRWRALKADSV